VELDLIVFVARRVAIGRIATFDSRANEYLIPKGKGLSACTAMSIGTGPIAALVIAEAEETGKEKERIGTTFLGLLCSAIRPML
jgi:hypothetical protein